MTTITKSIEAPVGVWTQVDAGYSTLSMKRKYSYLMFYFIGASAPVSDAADGVQPWVSGAITIRDLAGSKVYVKATDDANEVDLVLGSSAIPLLSATASFVDVTLSLDTSAYAVGDVLAATQEIVNAVPSTGGATALHSLLVLDKDDLGLGLDLVFLDANVSIGTENAAVSITDADAARILGVVPVAAGDFVDLGGCRVATLKGIGLALRADIASRSIYVAAISRGTGTYTAAGISLRLGFI